MTDINIVLVGKTGHGKSSTGNTILQKNYFEVASSGTDGTEMLELKTVEIENRKLKIYDTPGIMNLISEEKLQRGFIREEMRRLMEMAKTVHVFVFVFNYICRFTPEENDTVKDLKAMFGENFLRNHGMVVVTHGDTCEREALEKGISCDKMFQGWCKGAGEGFEKLKSEVGENILLVNNKGDFNPSSQRLKSSRELRDMIQLIFEKKTKFTKEDFHKINKSCVIL